MVHRTIRRRTSPTSPRSLLRVTVFEGYGGWCRKGLGWTIMYAISKSHHAIQTCCWTSVSTSKGVQVRQLCNDIYCCWFLCVDDSIPCAQVQCGSCGGSQARPFLMSFATIKKYNMMDPLYYFLTLGQLLRVADSIPEYWRCVSFNFDRVAPIAKALEQNHMHLESFRLFSIISLSWYGCVLTRSDLTADGCEARQPLIA